MKKLLFLFVVAFSVVSFISCFDEGGKKEGKEALIGSWLHLYDIEDGEKYECSEPGECILKFTKTTMVDYCKDDLFNGKQVEYVVKGNTIWILSMEGCSFTVTGKTLILDYGGGDCAYFQKM